MSGDPHRGDRPQERLTRIADRMTDVLHADPEYHDGDRCMIFLDDSIEGGICMDGYDDDTSAIADLLMHLRAMMKVNGKRMDIMFMNEDGTDRING